MRGKAPLFIIASAASVLLVHVWILLGAGIAAAAVCAFALMIGAPIAILFWLGSLTDGEAQRRAQARKLRGEHHDALLWQRTMDELQPTWPEYRYVAPADVHTARKRAGAIVRRVADIVAAAFAPRMLGAKRLARPIVGL